MWPVLQTTADLCRPHHNLGPDGCWRLQIRPVLDNIFRLNISGTEKLWNRMNYRLFCNCNICMLCWCCMYQWSESFIVSSFCKTHHHININISIQNRIVAESLTDRLQYQTRVHNFMYGFLYLQKQPLSVCLPNLKHLCLFFHQWLSATCKPLCLAQNFKESVVLRNICVLYPCVVSWSELHN